MIAIVGRPQREEEERCHAHQDVLMVISIHKKVAVRMPCKSGLGMRWDKAKAWLVKVLGCFKQSALFEALRV